MPVTHGFIGLFRLLHHRFFRHVDDDTVLPADMVFDESVWDHPLTDAVSYGITMQQSGWDTNCSLLYGF